MRKFLAGLNHVLEKVDEVGFLKHLRLTEWLAGKLFAAPVIMFAQARGTGSGELGHAGIFAISLSLRRAALNARDEAIGNGDLFAVASGVLTALGIVDQPLGVNDQAASAGLTSALATASGVKRMSE